MDYGKSLSDLNGLSNIYPQFSIRDPKFVFILLSTVSWYFEKSIFSGGVS